MSIQNAVTRVLVSAGVSRLTPTEKVVRAESVHDTCQGNAFFQGSQPCKDALGVWMVKKEALKANNAALVTARATVASLEQEEPTLIIDYDNAASTFATVVQTESKNDASIAKALNLLVRAEATHLTMEGVPTGVRVYLLKTKSEHKLTWDDLPGAAHYTAQMTTTPDNEASWTMLFGGGKTRPLPVLVPGQHYSFRVCGVDTQGHTTPWTQISFVA